MMNLPARSIVCAPAGGFTAEAGPTASTLPSRAISVAFSMAGFPTPSMIRAPTKAFAPADITVCLESLAPLNTSRAVRIPSILFISVIIQRSLFRRLLDLDRVDMRRAAHVRAEDDPFAVGREGHVRLQAVIVLRHVHQPLRFEEAGTYQFPRVRRFDPCHIRNAFGTEEVDPFAVLRVRHHLVVAAVSRDELAVRRDVEMHRPLVALQVVPCAIPSRELVAREPEVFAARRLQVVPDYTAVGAEEFVAGDLHVHRAGVNLAQI